MLEPFTIGALLALVSAVGWAGFDIVRKRIGRTMSATAAVIGVNAMHAPYILPFLLGTEAFGAVGGNHPVGEILFVGLPETSTAYWGLTVGSVVLNVAANFLFLRAVQISPLSLTTPYLAFTPVFTAVTGFLFYAEEPTYWGLGGIVTVCLGAFFLNPGNSEDGVWAPLKALWSERGSLYMLIVAALWSLTPILDKSASHQTSPMWHALILASGVVGVFLAYRGWRDGGVKKLWSELGREPGWLAFSGCFAVTALVLQLGSYEYIEVAYVETIKRAVGVLGAILAGYLLFDEQDIVRRLLGAALMAAGVAMVLLGG